MKILVTCPPMLGMREQFIPILESMGHEVICPDFVQVMTEEALCNLVPTVDGWVIGDDPATEKVFEAGVAGKLKAAVKWGVGVDNVDFEACKRLGISITNTPGMFGNEVADVAMAFMLGLARETHAIDRGIRDGLWPKNRGVSLTDKTVGIVGFGDIGFQTAKRMLAFDMNVITWDPGKKKAELGDVNLVTWPEQIEKCDFIVFTCALNEHNYHMLDETILNLCKDGVRVINVARGPLIDEKSLIDALKSGKVHSAALDVFEVEPLVINSYFRDHPLCILGSHNGSNTTEAVIRTNIKAINLLNGFLNQNEK